MDVDIDLDFVSQFEEVLMVKTEVYVKMTSKFYELSLSDNMVID